MKQITLFILAILCGTLSALAHSDVTFKFTENKGQLDSKVLYHNKLHLGDLFLEKDRFTFNMYDPNQLDELYFKRHGKNDENLKANTIPKTTNRDDYELTGDHLRMHAYSMIFENSNPNAVITSEDRLEGFTNYIFGNESKNWATQCFSYRLINYDEIYDGIDLEIYSSFKNLKYDFIVSAGANTNDISINYEGVKSVSILENGFLLVKLSNGEVKEMNPTSYQTIDGKRVNVPCNFKLTGNILSFEFPNDYDHSKELTIDPTWIFSTLSGSTADNWGFTATYDSLGNLYGAGIAFSSGYPTTGGSYSTSFLGGDFDIAVSKFNPTGTALLWATYIGGNDNEMPHSLVVDSNNDLIMLASTSSTNYPTTSGAFDETWNGGFAGTPANTWGSNYNNGCDIAITKFNTIGGMGTSTLIGGSDNEGLNESMVYNYADQGRGEIVLDANDNIYVATSLWSDDFPVTDGSVINAGAGFGFQDAVVFKMSANMANLNWATYLGGSSYEGGYSIRYSNSGTVYVTGGTTSTDFGADAGSVKPTFGGIWDGYIASFNGATGAHLNKTYLGTGNYDQGFILETDDAGDVYVVGQTVGTYPVANAIYSNANSGQFIHKMNSTLTTTDYSTVFGAGNVGGGSGIDISLTAFLVDNCGNVYVSGWGGGYNNSVTGNPYEAQAGGSTNGMPLTGDAEQSSTDGNDFYFFVMERNATGILYGSYLGDPVTYEHTDGGTSRFDPTGVVYQSVCASCGSGSFPTTPGVYSSGNPGGGICNLGAIKFEFDFQGVEAQATVPANITLCSTDYTVNFTSSGGNPQHEWLFGDGGSSTAANPTYTYADTGQYVVTYIAIDPASCNIRDTVYFNVDLNQAPTFNASFNLPVIPPCSDPLAVTVNATISGTGIDSTEWNMGDGTIYTDVTTISHDYTTEGIYPIEVIAWDLTCNVSDTIQDTLHFITTMSTATATAPSDTTLCSTPPFDMDFTSDGGTPYVFWDFGDGNSSSAPNPQNTYADSGAYQVMFIAIDSNTCNIADTVYFNVTLNQAATFNASFNLPVIPPCSDPAAVTVNATVTGTGIDSLEWNMGDGTIYTDTNTIAHDYTLEGIYPIQVIAWDLTCNYSDTIYDTLNFITVMSTAIATAPSDTTLCSNPPFLLDFTSSGTPDNYWDFGDGNTSGLANPSNSYADSGSYQVMYVAIDSSTCNIADTVFFSVNLIQAPTFIANFTLPTIPPCSDPSSVTINASFGGSGADSLVWDMGDGTFIFDSTSISYNYTTQGIYDIVVTAYDFCGNDTSIYETFHFLSDSSLAVASAPEDTTLCTLPPFSIGFTSSGTSADQLWDFGDGSTSNQANPTHVFADSGTYMVTYIAIDSNTCNIADTAVFNVSLIQAEQFSAELNFTPPPPCGGDSMLVELAFSGTAADSLIWDMGNGDVFYTDSVTYYYTESGIYDLSLTAFDFTCDLIEVISSEVPYFGNISTEVRIPNVFTPNGDGENDLLTFVNVNGSDVFSLTIWNRWGKKVFVTDDPLNHWDGVSMKDKEIHEGVYYFEILFTDVCSDEEQLRTGFVHLMR